MSLDRIWRSREIVGPALLLGPRVVVGAGVVFELLPVVTRQLLAAELADGLFLGRLDWGAVLVHRDAGTGLLGLLVVLLDAVFLGDGHFDCVVGFLVFGFGLVIYLFVFCFVYVYEMFVGEMRDEGKEGKKKIFGVGDLVILSRRNEGMKSAWRCFPPWSRPLGCSCLL